MAVFCRSQFIYNRVTFAAIDPMWRFFRHGVVLTRTAVEETVETFSQLAERAVSVRFSDDKLDKEWAQDGVSIKFSPLVTERNSTVDPGQIPDSYQRIPLKDVSRLFTEKIREYDGQTQLLQQWFVEIVNKDKLSNDVLASFLAIMPLAGVLGEIAVFGGFLETVDISPQGDVFFKDKNYWKDLKLKNNFPPSQASDPSPVPPPPEAPPEPEDPYTGGKPLNFRTPLNDE